MQRTAVGLFVPDAQELDALRGARDEFGVAALARTACVNRTTAARALEGLPVYLHSLRALLAAARGLLRARQFAPPDVAAGGA